MRPFLPLALLSILASLAGCGGNTATISAPPEAPTVSFTVSPPYIQSGQAGKLTWVTSNASEVTIDAIGAVSSSGSETVTPAATITYNLTATGPGGTQTASAVLTVTPLASWFLNGFAGKKMVVWGNSTVSNATEFFNELAANAGPGQALDGMTVTPQVLDASNLVVHDGNIYNYGSNGASLYAMLRGDGAYPISAVCSAAPDLLIMRGPLINDVRLGNCDLACAEGSMKTALDELQSCIPNAAILLTTENSLLTTDPSNSNWVQPETPEAAQEYTDIMHDAVMSMQGKYPNVFVYDIMALEYGTTCPATSPLMANQLHPNVTGQQKEADLDLPIIGKPTAH